MKRCSHHLCNRRPTYNIEGLKTAAYCKQHAEDGMVDVRSRRCRADSCKKQPNFNVGGSKTAAYCKQHAGNGMVNVFYINRCSQDSCPTRASFNAQGNKKGAYCKTHALDGMVVVRRQRCSHDSCAKWPSFNVQGKKAAYCRQHASEGMVEVNVRLCVHSSCSKRPGWGVLADGAPTACFRHKGDLLGSPVINFRGRCKVVGCAKLSRWGLDGKHLTHCPEHGPMQDGLVCTVQTARHKSSGPSIPSSHGIRGPSFHVKTECVF